MSDEAIQDIRRVLVEEAQSDTIGLWLIVKWVKDDIPLLNEESAKQAALRIIRESMENGEVVAGTFADQDEETAVFVPWSLTAEEAVARIGREWNALDREPNLGDIVWFVDPRILPVSASKHPMGKDWQPKPE